MNRQNVTILGLVGVLIGVLAIAGLQYNESEADITNETKAEMFNFMAKNYVTQKDHEDALEDLEDDLKDAIAHPHTEFPGIATSLSNIRNDITDIRNDIRNDTPNQDSNDFNLESCMDYNCTDEGSRFEAGDVIYVRGDNPSNDRSLEYRVYDEDNDRLDSRNVSMQQNGPFIIAYQTDNDLVDGTYRIVVEIDNEEDSINFIID